MTATVRGRDSNRTARLRIPPSPMTRAAGNDSASANNFTMISGPMPHASPIVIAIGKSSRLGILFHFHQSIPNGSLAAEPASLGYQRQRLFSQKSHNGYPGFHLTQDFERLGIQRITERIGCVAAGGNDSTDPAFTDQSTACLRQPINNSLCNLGRRQIQFSA